MDPETPLCTSDAAEILDIEFGDDPAYEELRAQERAESQVAPAISDVDLIQKEKRRQALQELAALSQELGLGY